MKTVIDILFENADAKYKNFHSALMPTVGKDKVIGVRVPVLRRIAKELIKNKDFDGKKFLEELPHEYYEENLLHAFIIADCKDANEAFALTNVFLPYVDNWAVCDMFNPKAFAKDKKQLWTNIEHWLDSDKTYTVRFGIVCAMRYFLDEDFTEEKFLRVMGVSSNEYYVNMALAWYLSFALIKQYSCAEKLLKQNVLPVWVQNKGIQKAVESYRISEETKNYLKTLKIHE